MVVSEIKLRGRVREKPPSARGGEDTHTAFQFFLSRGLVSAFT